MRCTSRTVFFDTPPRSGETHRVTHAALVRAGALAAAVALLASPSRSLAAPNIAAPGELTTRPGPGDAELAAARTTAPARPSPNTVLDARVRAGRYWRLDTARGAVHVWAPADYDARTAATVVFVHGYHVDVDAAWTAYRLPEQFALSGINALFIAPEAPTGKWDPLAWPSLATLVHTVGAEIDLPMPSARLVAIGHSGAYRTLGAWLANTTLDTVITLDTVYIEYGLLPWARSSPEHRLINIVYETGRVSEYLHRRLRDTLRVDGLPMDRLPDARVLYVRTGVGHWQLVTDGVALPLALRAIGVPELPSAPRDLPLGLPPRWEPVPEVNPELAPAALPFALPSGAVIASRFVELPP